MKGHLRVKIEVRVDSWVHPQGRPRQLLVCPQQDTASLRLWTSSGGCYDRITLRHNSFQWIAQRARMAFWRILSPLPVKQWCRERIQPKHMVRGKDKKKGKSNGDFSLQCGLSPTEASDEKKVMTMPGNQMTGLLASGLTTLWLQLLDGHGRELTLLRWWHPLWILPTILTHMVLDLGCTHATIEGVGLIASLVSWHITPSIQPRSWNSTSPHMFRGGLTLHRSNGKSNLTCCWKTCWVQFFHKSSAVPAQRNNMINPTEGTFGFLCQATRFLHFQGQNRIALLPCNESLQKTGNRNLHELVPGTHLLVMQTPVSLDVDIATTLEEKVRNWETWLQHSFACPVSSSSRMNRCVGLRVQTLFSLNLDSQNPWKFSETSHGVVLLVQLVRENSLKRSGRKHVSPLFAKMFCTM